MDYTYIECLACEDISYISFSHLCDQFEGLGCSLEFTSTDVVRDREFGNYDTKIT